MTTVGRYDVGRYAAHELAALGHEGGKSRSGSARPDACQPVDPWRYVAAAVAGSSMRKTWIVSVSDETTRSVESGENASEWIVTG